VNNRGEVVGAAYVGGQNACQYGYIWSVGTLMSLGAGTEARVRHWKVTADPVWTDALRGRGAFGGKWCMPGLQSLPSISRAISAGSQRGWQLFRHQRWQCRAPGT